MTKLKKRQSYHYHLMIAFVLAIWLAIFLILIAPFDIAELSIGVRLEIMPMYGLISFLGYLTLIPLQIWANKRKKSRSIIFEILVISLFNVLVLSGSYIYYRSSIVNGDFSFVKFTFEVYLPIFFIQLPIIIIARWFVSKKGIQNDSGRMIIKGDNKLDILQIKNDDLICISSADNYVNVTYLINGKASNKLLRTTLKNIETEHPELVKVHRSYLINPFHFKEWKNANTLLLTQIEVPVSKSYKKALMELDHSSLKASASPLPD